MEHKIGEIFEHNGEWCQCVKGWCQDCCFNDSGECHKFLCTDMERTDSSSVIFKKLEKVGEPEFNTNAEVWMQCYTLYAPISGGLKDHWYRVHGSSYIKIEIKQNKEDMEEKKVILGELAYKFINGKITYDAFEKGVIELCNNKGESKSTLKEFDFEAAKAGKPVCTRDGRKARIICFDAKFPKTGNIVTLVEKENGEEVTLYHYDDGHCSIGRGYDLMMLSEKKEGWINVYKVGARLETGGNVHSTKDAAIKCIDSDKKHIAAVKIEYLI